jgi:hypothetical protein
VLSGVDRDLLPSDIEGDAHGAKDLKTTRGHRLLAKVSGWGTPELIAVAVVLGSSAWCLAPPSDPDVWWHVRTGDWILQEHRLPGVDSWSLTAAGNTWVTHAWLSQVILSLFYKAGGLTGLSVFRCIGVTGLLTCLAVQAFRRTSPAKALAVTVLAVLGTFGGWGERPQLLSFLLLVPAAELVRRAVAGRVSVWWVVPLTYLWANLHGLWFLAPALVCLGALGAASGAANKAAAVRPFGLAALSCVAVAGATPNGPVLLVQPFKVNGYGQFVSEWGPPSIHSIFGFGLFAMIAALLVAYARRTEPVGLYQLAQVLFAVVLGLMYIRTVAPAVVLLTPLLADALGRTRQPAAPSFPPAVVRSLLGVLVALGVSGGAFVLTAFPDLPPAAPVAATAALVSSVPGDERVLNDYDLGGWLLLMAPSARPAIDGRTEIFPVKYVEDYLAALALSGDWRATIKPLKPNAALLRRTTPLVNGLRDDLGWQEVFKDDTWIVLIPPSTSPHDAGKQPQPRQ